MDASGVGLGIALVQEGEDGVVHLVAYASNSTVTLTELWNNWVRSPWRGLVIETY